MIDRKKVHKDIRRLQKVKSWQLVILLILSSFLSATFLRLNNINMIERRTAVISADETGDAEKIQDRLYDLQRYVSTHMNTDLGKGVYLEESYKRDAAKAYDAVQNDSEVYQLVQQYCRPQFSYWSQAYVQCVSDKLSEYPETELPSELNPNAYLHNFASPVWSPDFAGWSVLISAILLLMIIIRAIGYFILKSILKYKNPVI